MPYGNVDDHGTMFVGFSADQKRLSRMLDSMAGLITARAMRSRALLSR
jgi:putative iron-dependent peroxidase